MSPSRRRPKPPPLRPKGPAVAGLRVVCRAAAVLSVAAGLALPANGRADETLPLNGPLTPAPMPPAVATELPDALARFSHEARRQERTGAEFLAFYQRFIQSLDATAPPPGGKPRTPEQCAALAVWAPYQGAQQTLTAYDDQARRTRAAASPLRAYAAAGYGSGLTPDLQDHLGDANRTWAALSEQQRALQAIFTHQMAREVNRLGCDSGLEMPASTRPEGRVAGKQPPRAAALQQSPSAVQTALSAPAPEPAPAQPPVKAGWGEAIAAPAPTRAGPPPPMTLLQDPTALSAADAALAASFLVDNTGCGVDLVIYLDGQKVGLVPARTRGQFATVEGPHELCVASEGAGSCLEPGEARSVSIYDGWSLRPGC